MRRVGPESDDPAVILLCAGRGTRMLPLTEHVPKCMLEVGGRPLLGWLLDAIQPRFGGELVVVTGFGRSAVEDWLARHAPRVRTAHNERFDEDVNILSVEIGVSALERAERGYVIVETDLLLAPACWDRLAKGARTGDSYWVCRGSYGPELTGGIVHEGPGGVIDRVEYQPAYDPAYDGWAKMLGMLIVGPREVALDTALRRECLREGVRQYYLRPWTNAVPRLAARVLALDGEFARSFNTEDEFHDASAEFLREGQGRPSMGESR